MTKCVNNKPPPHFITRTTTHSHTYIVVYLSLRVILSISISCFHISLPSCFPNGLLPLQGIQLWQSNFYLHFYFCWCIILFVSDKCNFIPFILVMNDMVYRYGHMRMRMRMSMHLRVYDNPCHKMHAITLWKYAKENLTKMNTQTIFFRTAR